MKISDDEPPQVVPAMGTPTGLDHDAWVRDGYLLVPGAVPGPLVDALRRWADEIATRPDGDGGLMQHYELTDDGAKIARSEYLLDAYDGVRELVCTGWMPAMGAELIGEPIVLYKEKINYKLVGGAGFDAHQDAPAYRFVDTHLTCMVTIDDATTDNGCLEVASGLHDALLPEDGDGCIDTEVAAGLDWRPVPMSAGDVLWFHSRTPHRSGPNRSDTTRRALFCTYNAAAEGDLRERYYADKRAWFAATGAGSARLSIVGGFAGVSPSPDQLREIGATR